MEFLAQALRIRLFEQGLLKLYEEGHLYGTVHTCVGQEMVGVAAAAAFQEGDVFCSNHRGHGHFLGLTGDQEGLLAEVLGRQSGVCGGRGGTQHLYHPRGFYSNGIQGGMAPVASGLALAARLFRPENMVFLFIGDGTLGEGALYESLNIASKWGLPLLVTVVNNGIAQTTPIETTLAGSVKGRAEAFGIEYRRGDTWDWQKLIELYAESAGLVREKRCPLVLEVETARLNPHSKGDDTRAPELVKDLWARDPLALWLASSEESQALEAQLRGELEELTAKVLACATSVHQLNPAKAAAWPGGASDRTSARVAEEVNCALAEWMAQDEKVVVLGEDLQSPYGGAFKITKGLTDDHPDRVFCTPISEAAIVGLGTGLALGGAKPVVEIMFGDFLGLAFDQVLNHAAKFSFMFNERVSVPLLIRTPMGGYRGYGPTHSQSLEKHLLGIPNLHVVAPNSRVCNYTFYRHLAKNLSRPTLVVENKLLYTRFTPRALPLGFQAEELGETLPTVRLFPKSKNCDVTVLCYGGMLDLAEEALMELFESHDVLAEVLCPTQLYPLDLAPVADSVRRTGALVILEEGLPYCGFGAEVVAQLCEFGATPRKLSRVAATDFIPAARTAEAAVLPSSQDLVHAVTQVLSASRS